MPFCRVHPGRVREFARSIGLLAKTDRLDARLLARFAEHGVHVILDMHQDVYGEGFGGNGAPRWTDVCAKRWSACATMG